MTDYLARRLAAMQRLAQAARNAPRAEPAPPRPDLVDQLKTLLATMPESQTERLHIPTLQPHLEGKFRARPHMLHIGRALKLLGYAPVRSWRPGEQGVRFWIRQTPKGN